MFRPPTLNSWIRAPRGRKVNADTALEEALVDMACKVSGGAREGRKVERSGLGFVDWRGTVGGGESVAFHR